MNLFKDVNRSRSRSNQEKMNRSSKSHGIKKSTSSKNFSEDISNEITKERILNFKKDEFIIEQDSPICSSKDTAHFFASNILKRSDEECDNDSVDSHKTLNSCKTFSSNSDQFKYQSSELL